MPVPGFRHRGGGGNKDTSLDASCEVRRMNLDRYTKGGETARKAVPFLDAPIVGKFPTLPHGATQTQIGGETHPSPRG